MRFLKTDPFSCAGRLIPRQRAPKCHLCGRILWAPIWKENFWPQRNAKGERLGYVPAYHGTEKKPCCWNGKLCEARRKSST